MKEVLAEEVDRPRLDFVALPVDPKTFVQDAADKAKDPMGTADLLNPGEGLKRPTALMGSCPRRLFLPAHSTQTTALFFQA
jgi:hypothetical protein